MKKIVISDARVDGLAADPIGRNLYYADAKENVIGVMTLTGQSHKTLLREMQPRGLLVDTKAGYVLTNHTITWIKDHHK